MGNSKELAFASAKCLLCRREEAAKQPQSMTFGHGKRLGKAALGFIPHLRA